MKRMVTISLEDGVVEEIDECRGGTPRSAYIRNLIEDAMYAQAKEQRKENAQKRK